MARTLLVTMDYLPRTGGVARYYGRLVAELGADATVLTSVAGPAAPGVLRRQLSWRLWPHWLPLLWVIPRAMREAGADRLWIGEVAPTGVAALLLKLTRGTPYAVSVHGLDIQLQARRSFLRRFIVRQVLQHAQFITSNSAFTASLLNSWGIPQSRRVVVLPGVDAPAKVSIGGVEEFRARYQLVGKLVLLTVCRLVRRKGVDDVLAVLPELQRKFPDLTYVVVGDGPERTRLEKLAHQLRVSVLFAGAVDEPALNTWYQMCDVFVLTPKDDPTDVEGFGMVYLEAQAAGKPVVATRVGGVPEAVGDAGLLVTSTMELQTALHELLISPAARESLGQQGSRRVQGFTWAGQAAILRRYLYGN